VTLHPQPACGVKKVAGTSEGSSPEPKVTIADVLEAAHQATHLPIVSDHYTRLYKAKAVSIQSEPLFEALNRLTETMRLRWDKDREGSWLQFRGSSFYNDRVKEVPHRPAVHPHAIGPAAGVHRARPHSGSRTAPITR
jgi:hypothetical protein